MNEEQLVRFAFKDIDPFDIESFGDEPENLLNLLKLSDKEIYSKNQLRIPNEIKLTEYIDPYPNKDYNDKRLGREEDNLSLNIKQNNNYKNIEKDDIYAPQLGKLSINSFIKDPLSLVTKPNSLGSTLSWLRQSSFQSSFSFVELGAALQPEDLPNLALPILEFIEDTQPHIIIGCDRGGRLFSLAIHAAWQHTRDGQLFPTIDGKIHFARISQSENTDVLQDKVDEIVVSAKQMAAQRGNAIDDEQLRVMFVDDWVIGGGTMRLAQRLVNKYGAKTYFAVMCGEGANVSGQPNLHTTVSWHDRPEEIGVNYLSSLFEKADGSVTQRQEVVAVRGEEAIRNRRRIQTAAKALSKVATLEEVAA